MSNLRRIRRDEFGPFVLTGGYVFRPPAAGTKYDAHMKVNGHHVGGTQTAKVGGEEWKFYYGDPRYIEYAEEPYVRAGLAVPHPIRESRFWSAYEREWEQYVFAANLNRETVSGNDDEDECP